MPQTAVNPVNGATVAWPGGPLEILVNNTKWNGERIDGVTTDPMTGHKMYTFETRPDFTLDGTGKNWIGAFLEPHPRDLTDPAYLAARQFCIQKSRVEGIDAALAAAEKLLVERGALRPGDTYAITCGEPMGHPGGTNMLKVCRVA